MSAQLLFLESENNTKDIYLYINSPGGIVADGLAIYDTMQYIKPAVSTLCIGQAASMGSFLLAAGAKGQRDVTTKCKNNGASTVSWVSRTSHRHRNSCQ